MTELGNIQVLGSVSIDNTVGSADTTIGSLIVLNGVAIGENVWIGGYANIKGAVTIQNSDGSSDSLTGALIVGGGIGIF